MSAAAKASAPAAYSGGIKTHLVEDHLIVINGSTRCPSPEACDIRENESYASYVWRHAFDHGVVEYDMALRIYKAPFVEFVDAERNLFIWCFYAFHKFCIGNPSISPYPFWEHHYFLSEWDYHPDDLEQLTEKAKRVYVLPAADKQRSNRITKRFKKCEKPRGTQKTSVTRAYATWRHLRARFVDDSVNFRVLVISASTRLARDHYFKPLKTLWKVNGNLRRLFGAYELRCPRCKSMSYSQATSWSSCACGAHLRAGCADEAERGRCPMCVKMAPPAIRVGLVTKGSAGSDSIQMRWNLNPGESYSGMAAVSLMIAGADTESTGQRFDLTLFDDPSTKKNSRTLDLRAKIKMLLAELMKQLDQAGQLVINCTRKHFDDMAGDIDKPAGPYFRQFHIFHRKATWIDPITSQTKYYWPVDAEGKPRLNEEFLRNELENSSERDFYSEYQNEPQNPDDQTFRPGWFEPIATTQCPPIVLYGLGEDLSADHKAYLEREGLVQRNFVFVDPAGQEKVKARNDDTAIVGVRIFAGIVYIVYLRSFKGPDSKEKEEIYQSAVFNKPSAIRYEMPAHSKGVEQGFFRWCGDRTEEMRKSGVAFEVALPMLFRPISTVASKQARIESTETLWRNGRIKIVKTEAGTPDVEIAKFRDQHCAYGVADHDDYPDAFSGVMAEGYIGIAAPQLPAAKPSDIMESEDGRLSINIGSLIDEMRAPKTSSRWGTGGGREL